VSTSREIEKLVSVVSKLPGMGHRSASRVVAHLLKRRNSTMVNLISSLDEIHKKAKICEICNNIDTSSPCRFCFDSKRDPCKLCVVSDLTNLWAIERTRSYDGLYFVLGGKLSIINGISPEDLYIEKMIKMIEERGANEVILAMNQDLDGQATMFFIQEKLSELTCLKITTLSQGIPSGGDLDFLDEGTISTAIRQRVRFGS
jgi:recombination protein RecR